MGGSEMGKKEKETEISELHFAVRQEAIGSSRY